MEDTVERALARPIAARDLTAVLSEQAARTPNGAWIIAGDSRLTFGQAAARSTDLAARLAALGLKAGETVLIMLPNCVEFVVAWCALARIGALEVPLNTQLKGRVLAHQVGDSRARIAVVAAALLDDFLNANRDEGAVEQVLLLGPRPAGLKAGGVEIIAWEDLLAGPPPPPVERPPPCYKDLIAVMYTSGTTGPSKGCMITHAHAYEYANCLLDLADLRSGDVHYCVLPLFHIAGQWAGVYACLQAGIPCVLAERFSATGFWDEARARGATTSFLLGAMAHFLNVQEPRPDDADNPLERVLVVPLIPDIEGFKRRFGVQVSATWGSTEVNVPLRSGFDLPDAETCGYVAEDRYEVRIVDENDFEVPDGRPGEAVVRAKQPWTVMAGYWGRPEATREAWRNLWLHSGDIMKRGANGWFYFVDRKSDSIRRRGENISSVEVENEINAHPAVAASAVYPIKAAASEDEVMASVVLRPGQSLTPEALTAFLAARLARFQQPRYLAFLDDLPKTPTGKIQKYLLRDIGVTPDTWDREAGEL